MNISFNCLILHLIFSKIHRNEEKTLVASFGLMVSSLTFAGGLLTNTNQNVAFLRNPARDGAIGIDGVYSNPAGVAFCRTGCICP